MAGPVSNSSGHEQRHRSVGGIAKKLHWSVPRARGNRGLAQRLVGAGAEIGDALHWAIQGGHGEIVRDLLESGASFAARIENGYTPLHLAAYQAGRNGDGSSVAAQGGRHIHINDDEWTPLLVAVYEGRLAVTRALLAAGADVSLQYGESKTPVIHVAARKDVEMLGAVIEHGADLEAVATDQTTAHAAASINNAGAIDVLVNAGANIEARNDRSETPLQYASDRLSHQVLLALLKRGANINALDVYLQTPLLVVAAASAGTQRTAERGGGLSAESRCGRDHCLRRWPQSCRSDRCQSRRRRTFGRGRLARA